MKLKALFVLWLEAVLNKAQLTVPNVGVRARSSRKRELLQKNNLCQISETELCLSAQAVHSAARGCVDGTGVGDGAVNAFAVRDLSCTLL